MNDELLNQIQALNDLIDYLRRSIARKEEKIRDCYAETVHLATVMDSVKEDIIFCINNMKSEFACTDKRTNRELHTMVGILEKTLTKIEEADS